MALKVAPTNRRTLAAAVLAEMRLRQAQKEHSADLMHSDVVGWGQQNFYSSLTGRLIEFLPHQKCIMRYAYKRRQNGRMPFKTVVYSCPKKSGKTTIASVVGRWFAETQSRYADVCCIGNDLDQAKGRSYKEIRISLEQTPGFDMDRHILPSRWNCKSALTLKCLSTGSQIRALSVDAKGEAGGAPILTIWTELWGFEHDDALKFWNEMTITPTIPDSQRLVETYAGFDGESELLWGLYEAGHLGRQLTAHDLAMAGATDQPGESYEELLFAFEETGGNPNAKVPCWVNDTAELFMYWDEGIVARRMPWQKGVEGESYYRSEEITLPPKAFEHLHLNHWVGAESQFVPIESWDSCYDPSIVPLEPGSKEPIVVALDAATTGDCFGAAAFTRNKQNHEEVDVRAYRRWDPREEGGRIDYSEVEEWVRQLCAAYNVVQICYDPYQLEDMMQRFRRESVTWCEPFNQGQERLKADRKLYDLIMRRGIHHREDPQRPGPLREHVLNSNAKLQKDQDSTMRIVKRSPSRKIDLTVCLSMGAARCLYLLL